MNPEYDVAIIGGGPAGSTAATFLARKKYKVIILEREKFPRFHIGESLLPYSMGAFERLGVKEKLDARFLAKHGAEISTMCGTNVCKFFFKDAFQMRYPQAYQVTRSEFDEVLLDHAAENGAEVRQETAVESIDFSGKESVALNVKSADGTRTITARYVLDCSGRSSVIGSYFKLRKTYENLKKFSVFAHYENVDRDEGLTGTFIRIITGREGWFWMIPLTPTKMSIGIVMDLASFKAMKKTPEAALEDIIREQPMVNNRMANAKRVTEVHSVSDYSYRNERLFGDRWLLAGDAAGFIDPVFSTGVFLAIRSGEAAAETLDTVLRSAEKRLPAFKSYERDVKRVMNLYLQFVSAWYKPRFAEIITHPVSRLQLVEVVNSVLAGNLASSTFSIWWRMQLFYLVAFLQRYIPLCPRVSLDPKDCNPAAHVAKRESETAATR